MTRDQIRDDIRTTSEDIVDDAETLTEIEEKKLHSNADPKELERLSQKAEDVAYELAHKASVEKRLVSVANSQDRLRQAGKWPKKDDAS